MMPTIAKILTLIGKVEESLVQTKATSKHFKRVDNLPCYELVYVCSSNNLQCTITKPLCF